MARGISTGLELLIPIVVIFAHSYVECEIAWDLEKFLSIRKDDEQREICCEIPKINAILEHFPSTEIKHIVKLTLDGRLEEYCRDLAHHLKNLFEQVISCCFDLRDAPIKEQIEGIDELHSLICLDKCFHRKLTKDAKCLYEVLNRSDKCLGSHNLTKAVRGNKCNWPEDEKELCPRVNTIIRCFVREATSSCSTNAAAVLNTLFKRVGRATVRANCGWSFTEQTNATVSESHHPPKLIAVAVVLCMIILSLLLLRWNFRRKTN